MFGKLYFLRNRNRFYLNSRSYWGHSIITFGLRGEGRSTNANICKQGEGRVTSMRTVAYKFL